MMVAVVVVAAAAAVGALVYWCWSKWSLVAVVLVVAVEKRVWQ